MDVIWATWAAAVAGALEPIETAKESLTFIERGGIVAVLLIAIALEALIIRALLRGRERDRESRERDHAAIQKIQENYLRELMTVIASETAKMDKFSEITNRHTEAIQALRDTIEKNIESNRALKEMMVLLNERVGRA